MTQVPSQFFHPLVINVMRHHFATFGEINRWVPLASFGRIMVVYRDEDDAERAKLQCDPLILEASYDRYAPPIPLSLTLF